MRIDIPKDSVAADERRVEGVKYLLSDRPEFMDMNPIYRFLTDASGGRQKNKRKFRWPTKRPSSGAGRLLMLAKVGLKSLMPEEAYRNRNFEWSYAEEA